MLSWSAKTINPSLTTSEKDVYDMVDTQNERPLTPTEKIDSSETEFDVNKL